MLLTFPIASLNHYTPNFSGVTQKLTWCQQFGLQIFPKWGYAHILPQKNAVFRRFSGQTVDFRLQHVIHIWKAMALSYNLVHQEIISVHPTRCQIFAGKTDLAFWNIWQWVIYGHWSSKILYWCRNCWRRTPVFICIKLWKSKPISHYGFKFPELLSRTIVCQWRMPGWKARTWRAIWTCVMCHAPRRLI